MRMLRAQWACIWGGNLPINLEDKDFSWNILRKNKSWDREQKLSSIRRAIVKRNAEQDVWGWKYPRIDNYFDDIFLDIVNPMLVCVFRDPVASSWRGVVRQQRLPAQAIHETLKLQANNLRIIEKSGAPTLLISYEKAIANPLQLVKMLNQFMSLGMLD